MAALSYVAEELLLDIASAGCEVIATLNCYENELGRRGFVQCLQWLSYYVVLPMPNLRVSFIQQLMFKLLMHVDQNRQSTVEKTHYRISYLYTYDSRAVHLLACKWACCVMNR